MMQFNQNNLVDAVRFLQQFSTGYGDYTKEKYEREDISPEEAEALMKGFNKQ